MGCVDRIRHKYTASSLILVVQEAESGRADGRNNLVLSYLFPLLSCILFDNVTLILHLIDRSFCTFTDFICPVFLSNFAVSFCVFQLCSALILIIYILSRSYAAFLSLSLWKILFWRFFFFYIFNFIISSFLRFSYFYVYLQTYCFIYFPWLLAFLPIILFFESQIISCGYSYHLFTAFISQLFSYILLPFQIIFHGFLFLCYSYNFFMLFSISSVLFSVLKLSIVLFIFDLYLFCCFICYSYLTQGFFLFHFSYGYSHV